MSDLGGVRGDDLILAADLPRHLFQRFDLGARMRRGPPRESPLTAELPDLRPAGSRGENFGEPGRSAGHERPRTRGDGRCEASSDVRPRCSGVPGDLEGGAAGSGRDGDPARVDRSYSPLVGLTQPSGEEASGDAADLINRSEEHTSEL